MARSHHRKKHKQHLKQFKSTQENALSGVSPSNRVSGTWMFGIVGLVVGLALGYFASGSVLWLVVGGVAGTAAGYVIGKRIDKGKV